MNNYNFDDEQIKEPSLWSKIASVFKFIAACLTFLRHTIANIIMLFFLLFVFLAFGAMQIINTDNSNNEQNVALTSKPAPILYINLKGDISASPLPKKGIDAIERQIDDFLKDKQVHSLLTIERALDKASTDKNIKLVILNLSDMMPTSLANTTRITSKIKTIKERGKKVFAFASSYSQSSYTIAKEASTIFLDPLGTVDIKGISLESLYYKDLLDKAHISPYIFKAGRFKSAVEPYLLNAMSDDVKEEYDILLHQMWRVYTNEVTTRKKISNKNLLDDTYTLYQRLSSYNFDIARMQQDLGLVDNLESFYFYKDKLIATYGASPLNPHEPHVIDYRDYAGYDPIYNDANIAVIYGIGPIVDKAKYGSDFAPENIIPQIERAMHDDNIKALVFYIDSPGGSAFASEQIRRALVKFRSKKKVVISMNSITASGGYWISTESDGIVATKDTITGSIGVFAISFGAHNLLNHFGVYEDGVYNSELARANIATAMSDNVQKLYQGSVDNTYRFFIKLVSKSRNLAFSDAPIFAEGQIFSAHTALNMGLIDKEGSLYDAIDMASALAKIKKSEIKVEHYINSSQTGIAFIDDMVLKAMTSFMPVPFAKVYTKYYDNAFLKQVMDKKDPTVMAISNCQGIMY